VGSGVAAVRRGLYAVDRRVGTRLERSVQVGRRIARLAGTRTLADVWTVAATVLLALPGWRWPLTIRVRGPHGPRPFTIPDWAGALVFEEVFFSQEYAAPVDVRPRRIVDLGSNTGVSILYFALAHPGAAIEGVEASPELFRLLQRNVGDLPGVTLHFGAVSADAGPVVFYASDSSWAGSTVAGDGGRPYEVPGVPLDELLAPGDVDLLKVDIEGGEFDVLPSSRRLRDVAVVIGEIHATPGSAEADALLAVFEGYDVRSTQFDPSWQWEHYTLFTAVRAS
jgi:FkbM family methyltransferase